MTDPSADRRSQLAQSVAVTNERIASLTQNFDEIVDAASEVATDDEHDPEGHTIAWERQQISALIEEATANLVQLRAAEERLDAGTYGVCVTCEREISPMRLDALPAAPNCVACA